MDANFWHQRWQNDEIGFHERDVNPHLVRHFPALALSPDSRVFLPLCGKTLDIAWLLAQGCRVAGAELSTLAIEQLFASLGVQPRITPLGNLHRYSTDRLDIFVGDILELDAYTLGHVDAVYDRAALVALPAAMRERYAAHLVNITRQAPQLLVTFEYDQALMPGPPFSVPAADVQRYYGSSHAPELLKSVAVAGGLKGKCPAIEHVWLLRGRA